MDQDQEKLSKERAEAAEQAVESQPEEIHSEEPEAIVEEAKEEPAQEEESEDKEDKPQDKPKASAKAIVKKYCTRWFIDAFTGMAQGLFVTLIAGTILCQIGSWCGGQANNFGKVLLAIGNFAKTLMGAGIGVGIAHKLGAKPLVIFAAAVSGFVGAWSMNIVNVMLKGTALSLTLGAPGNPIGAYVVALVAVEVAGLYAGKTKLDIVLVPLGMLLLTLGSVWVAWPFIKLIDLIGQGLVAAISAGVAFKIIVGVLVAVVLGVLLTMPTSSAAIWIAIAATAVGASEDYQIAMSIAGGAATAGCAAHMIGFAVASFRENKWGGLISQGIGTSMLQIPNIMRNPRIMIPEIASSVVAGLVAVLLDVRCNASGGGMGTSGLVGVFGIIEESQKWGVPTWKYAVGIVLCMFVIPAVVSFGVSELLRKVKWIKPGDQALQ
ncbi:MAG: PTS sugar transporter subunit IIC [Clostridia bacterium]|nr:PTS sugar transporter subunit IIC [Clostridia bacterium]